METVGTQQNGQIKEETSSKDHEKELSACIMHAIETDSAFKLYSFRIISPEQYISRIKELNQLLKKYK